MEHTLLQAGFAADANLSPADFRHLVRVMARYAALLPTAAAAPHQPQLQQRQQQQHQQQGGMEEDFGKEEQLDEMEEHVLYTTPHFIVRSERATLVTIDVLAAAQGALDNRDAAVTGAQVLSTKT